MSPILSDRETAILENLINDPSISQRGLARDTGMSLGLINLILKKLIQTGHLTVSSLNKRKLQYLLTPQGMNVNIRRSYRHVFSVIKNYKAIREKISSRLEFLMKEGYEVFILPEQNDLTNAITELLKEPPLNCITLKNEIEGNGSKSVLIRVGTEESPINFKGRVIDIVAEIMK